LLRTLVNVAMNVWVLWSMGNFLTSWGPVSFSGRTVLHEVIYICLWKGVQIQPPNTLAPDTLRHDCPAVCVTTFQYSSATFLALCFHSCKEKFGMHLKCVVIPFFNIFYECGGQTALLVIL
jgi:hypothetical protein